MSEKSPFGFASYVPGFEFLQDLTRQTLAASASGAAPAGSPGLGQWVAPTFNVEELDKRIQELKTVQFWLEQNARALAATVQALEVQKMTLSALRDMNVSLGDVAEAMKVKPASAPAPAASFAADPPPVATGPAAAPSAGPSAPSAEATAPAPSTAGVDPMQWWSALSQQFQAIASQAVQDVARAVPPVPPKASGQSGKAASVPQAKPRAAARARQSARPKAAARTAKPSGATRAGPATAPRKTTPR